MRVVGIDLAWREAAPDGPANESGLVAVDRSGAIVAAGWARSQPEVLDFLDQVAEHDTLLMVDAPLVVTNQSGQRLCEKQVGQRYGRWKVSANSTNLASPRLAGVTLLTALTGQGWKYQDGLAGPPAGARYVAEVYPYTALVGAAEFGYDLERPIYKRKPRQMPVAAFRPARAAACDELIARLTALRDADPPIDVMSHPSTRALLEERSPLDDRIYKHREDLIVAIICAWTGLLWLRHGTARCQVLGADGPAEPTATIIAPALPEQRRER